jgi:ABC-2 type transport system permease protein
VRLYWELARCGFRRTAIYRTAAISGVITNTFFGFLRAYIFVALYETRSDVGGYSLPDALTFTFVTQGMAALIALWAWWPIAESVQSGEVATDLSRPYDFEFAWLAQDFGRALYQFIARAIPPVVIGALVFPLNLPTDPLVWLATIPSLILAVACSFGWRFMLNLTTFWWIDHRGIAGISLLVASLLSGFMLPLRMWPDGLREAVSWLPFAAMVAVPIDVMLGKVQGPELWAALAFQVFWTVVLLALGRLMLALAMHKLVVQGG